MVNPTTTYNWLGYEEPIPYKRERLVIIIGGGLAAIKCAYVLQKHGIDFALIEPHHTLGGRIRGERFGNTYAEFGAHWITGTVHPKTGVENPIWSLAKACNLETRGLQDTSICMKKGEDVTDYFDESYEKMEPKREQMRNLLKSYGISAATDMSISEALGKSGW